MVESARFPGRVARDGGGQLKSARFLGVDWGSGAVKKFTSG